MQTRNHNAFTLVELLVVIAIMVTLVGITIGMINVSQDEDRVRAGAAQVQSFLEGARDRAIHAGEARGVRFIFDDESGIDYASSMLYVGTSEPLKGQIQINAINKVSIEFPSPELRQQWIDLRSRGLLPDTSQSGRTAVIRIGRTQALYTVNTNTLELTKAYVGDPGPQDYLLTLEPTVLPNQEPRTLPRDVVIDLTHSKVPASWQSGSSFGPHLDILFSPHGTVTGLASSAGVIYLTVGEGVDVFQGRGPGDSSKEGQERIVSIRTQTGSIGVHHVDPTDTDGTPGPDDPFRFASAGEPAK